MSQIAENRAERWLHALCPQDWQHYGAAIVVADGVLGAYPARYLAVVPDAAQRFVRARHGEVGLEQGWNLAQAVQDAITADADREHKRALVALIDVPSQAYGRREEAYGIHLALAAAVDAYASARLAGHPVLGLLVGQAMSGAFLAHGYQAHRLLALDEAGVMTQAMGKAAAARVTMRSLEQLETLAASILPMAYDIRAYAELGLLWRLLSVSSATAPDAADVQRVQQALQAALQEVRAQPVATRRGSGVSQAAQQVRARLREQWRAEAG
ncbi:biotin-independent malonate decarboxylase subunit gamma [Neisseriaceae bacterium TC5R-5]|nr:biotin-independent malonate decarboxylase subunit gamma [Neisseriaceae bacterium TC5R-5]